MTKLLLRSLGICWLLLSVQVHAQQGAEEKDPWEGFNRSIFSFNETLDEYVLLPVTKGYRYIAPEPVEKGVSNFFDNLNDVTVLINSLLQLKFEKAGHTTARLVANTFFGIGGIFDVATPMGLDKQNEDFGQTLGHWGVGTGPYVVLPLFGPSNIRDGFGLIPDYYTSPVTHLEDDEARLALEVLWVIDTRSGVMDQEKLISGDRYSFIRDVYMQRRDYLVRDGQIADSFEDDGF